MSHINTKECTFDAMRPKLAGLIERHRFEDDPVVFCYDVSVAPERFWGFLWGNPEPYDYAHVITAQKLISARRSKVYKGLAGVTSLDLVDIVKMEPTFVAAYGYMVTAHGAGEGKLDCPMALAARPRFIAALQRAIDDAQVPLQPPPAARVWESETAAGVAQRLRRLGELFEQNAISEEEYRLRRKAILDEL